MGWLRWVIMQFGRPGARRVIVVFALLLALPSLASPIIMDEYAQLLRYRESREPNAPSFLNTAFVFADPAHRDRDLESVGIWWMAPDLKIAFWRPLAAATQLVDFRLWPDSALLMHVHTLLWFALLLLAIAALYDRFLARATANLALAMYAWDDARGMVLSWVANRHALISTALGAGVLLVHDKWRRDGWPVGAWLGPVLLGLSLLSSEMGLATTGFLLGHALFVERDSIASRLRRLVPYALVVVCWQLVYSTAGYGAVGSGAYIHPLHEPQAYVKSLLLRAPLLLLGQLTPIASDLAGFVTPGIVSGLVGLAVVLVVLLAQALRPELASHGQARFWTLGALLALLPLTAAGPSDRNLCFVGLGVAPVLALAFERVIAQPTASRTSRIVLGALAVCNLAIAPLLLPLKSLYMRALQAAVAPATQSIRREHDTTDKTLVIVASPSEGPVSVTWWQRDALRIPRPHAARQLVTTFGETAITRIDDVTLRLQRDGGFFEADMHSLARGRSRPFHSGDSVVLSDMKVTTTEVTTDGRPAEIEFRFATSLDSPHWLWMRAIGVQLVAWSPPKVGETVSVSVTERQDTVER